MPRGAVSYVEDLPAGAALVAAAVVGDTVLQMDSVLPFADDGGLLSIDGGPALEYLSADDDAATLALANPLGGAFEDDTSVSALDYQGNASVTRTAYVDLGGDEPTRCTVPVELRPFFPTGYGLQNALVDVVRDPALGWVIAGKPEQDAQIDVTMLASPSIRRVNNDTDQAVPSSTWTPLKNWASVWSNGGVAFDSATGKFYGFTPGIWIIEAQVFLENAGASGRRELRAQLYTSLGDAEIARDRESSPGAASVRDLLSFSRTFRLVGDHAVSFDVWQNSGASLGVGQSGSPTSFTYCALTWVAP